MQKRRPIHGSISHGIYEITDRERVRAEEFATAMIRVAEEYLRGAVRISLSGESIGYTDIAVSTVAELIKRMLEGMRPEDVLDIRIELGDSMIITLEPNELPSVQVLARVVSLAKSAGFTVERDGKRFFLTSKIEMPMTLSIYAISYDDIYDELKYIFVLKT